VARDGKPVKVFDTMGGAMLYGTTTFPDHLFKIQRITNDDP
jgi:hypothetical protein